jgi:phosphoglycerate dehydrogenase-like enzyme
MTRILLGWQKAATQLDWIRGLAPAGCAFLVPERSMDQGDWDADPDALMRLAPQADIIVGWNFPPAVLQAAVNMKMLSSAHTGIDRYDLAMFRERGIMLTNASGVNAVAVAEHAMGLMLALAKRIVSHDASVRRVDWVDLSPETAGMLLAGKTAVILGLGRIGQLIAKRCRVFEMKTIGVKRDVSIPVPAVDELFPADRLLEALWKADVVFLALPLTPETRGLMGQEQFAALRAGALVINVGRGMVVREAAAHEALTTGTLGGFSADVWWDYADASPAGYHYNVPSRLHVHRLPNVVGTPDMASNVHGMRERMIEFAMENVREFLSGETPRRMIDLETGL